MSPEEIEENPAGEVQRKRRIYYGARVRFEVLTRDIPSGLPHPGGSEQIRLAGLEYKAAMGDFSAALKEFNTFLIEGQAPVRLRGEPIR